MKGYRERKKAAAKAMTDVKKLDASTSSEVDGSTSSVVDGSTSSKEVGSTSEVSPLKHPLENSWGLWLITSDKKNWEDNLVKLTSFDTVEDYWCLYHHTKTPSELDRGNEYAVFKNDIRPMWEDPANKVGGRWVIDFDKRRHNDLDAIWMYLVMLMIGETFSVPEAICGAVVSCRGKSKITIWVADYKNERAVKEVARTITDTLGLIGRLSFQKHDSRQCIYIM